MSNNVPEGLLATKQPDLFFEDDPIGRMKKEIWEASEAEVDTMLAEYGLPAPVEWGKPGVYLQMMTRRQLIEERNKNDIVFIPIGCTENHGLHLPSATDTLFVSQILEGVRRFIGQRDGAPGDAPHTLRDPRRRVGPDPDGGP